jgi:transcriptional regulator
MYLPDHFDERRTEEVHRIIRENPLAALVTFGPQGLDANHLPFEFEPSADGNGRLRAHVARANPVWNQVKNGSPVMVIFTAAQGYVSPNWYPSKHETHRQVPTWNYQVVHAHGEIQVLDDERFVRGIVARLTREHEGRTGDARPWRMSDSDGEYINGMLKAIVGIEIQITRLTAKSKLSQNKELRDRRAATKALAEHGIKSLADAMARTMPDTSTDP